jgi:hypothetical protein
VNISLELHIEDDELVGRARNGTGEGREFLGWLGLLCAIDALLDEKDAEGETR